MITFVKRKYKYVVPWGCIALMSECLIRHARVVVTPD